MSVLIEHADAIAYAFMLTIGLFCASAVLTLALGIVLGVMSVLPVLGFRVFAAAYVAIFRNVPPVLIFLIVTLCMPIFGIRLSFFIYAVIALTLYEASFIAQTIKSGINFIDPGQSEAARAIGMSGRQVLTYVIIPQALRNTVPTIANYMIALCKATSLAGMFGVGEATIQLKYLADENPANILILFGTIALGYLALNSAIGAVFRRFERKLPLVAA